MADQLHSTNIFAWFTAQRREITHFLVFLFLMAGIWLTRIYSYLLFHSLAEFFSIVVAFGVFIVAWNSAPMVKNNYLITLGIGSLFIALIDLVHTLAYKGMSVFDGYTANLPTQLWLAARYLQALTLFFSPLLFHHRTRRSILVAVFTLLTTALIASIFFDFFPTAYVEGSGLTPFKIASEYVIIAILAAAMYLLWRNRGEFDSTVFNWLIGSILATVAAEFAFTSYVGVTDTANLLGHIFKILAFYLLYRAVVETGFVRPYDLIFRKLKQEEQSERKARGEVEEQLSDLRSLSSQIMETMGQGLIVTNHVGDLEYVNPAFARLAGLPQQKLIGRNSSEINLVDKYSFLPEERAGQLKKEKVYETTLLRADGKPIPVLVTSVPRLQEDVAEGAITVVTDITQQKKSEMRLRKYNRSLTMLKDCNQILVRSDNEARLMQSMCEIIVKTGGYRMAWVGFAEQDQARSVRPVAQFGFDEGYLEQAQITWEDSERGRGPTGTAIREGTVQINQNFLTNPRTILWRESAIKQGYQSSIALPLLNKKIAFGALNILASTPDAFDEEELSLLTELAEDLAYGITMLRERERRQQAEDQIREMALFPTLNPDAVLQVDASGRIKKVNPAAVEMGFAVGARISESIPELSPEDLSACIATAASREAYETPLDDRMLLWIVHGVPKLGLAFLYSKDITERKRAERALQKAHDELERRVLERTEELASVNRELTDDIARRIQLEKALKASEEKANSLIQYAPTGIYEIDIFGTRFISVNDVVCHWTGYTREELFSIRPMDFLSEADRTKFWARIERKLAGNEIDEIVEYKITAKEGREIQAEVHIGPFLHDKDGKPESIFVIAHDITERKRAEEAMLAANAELTRFNNVMVGRELRMIELKQEVNELCARTGQPPRYSVDYTKEGI